MRSLRRAPWYASTVVAVIALSTALAATVFAIVDGVLFKPLTYADPAALYYVSGGFSSLPNAASVVSASLADTRAWAAAVPEVTMSTASIGTNVTISDNDYLRAAFVDRYFFDVVGVHPLLGGFSEADFGPAAKVQPAIVTYEVWQSRFGGAPDIIGRVLIDAGGEGARIVGVLPRGFVYPHPAGRVAPEALLAMRTPSAAVRNDPSRRGWQVIARLPHASSVSSIESRLRLAAREVGQQFPVTPDDPSASATRRITRGPFDVVRLRPLRDVLVAPTRMFALASFTVAAGLLLLGALNLAGLAAGRTLDRQRELTLRSALGGSTATLLRLLAVEHVIVVAIGTLLGLAIATLTLSGVTALLPVGILLLKTPAIDLRVAAFGLVAAVAAVTLVTIWSWRALRTRHLRPVLASSAGATARTRSPGRVVMMASQIAVALAMALGGALLSTSLLRVWHEDPGFAVDQTARIRINTPSTFPLEAQQELLDAVAHVPGVIAVAGLDEMFLERAVHGSTFDKPAGALETGDVENLSVTSGFFAAAGLAAVEGRLPTRDEFDRGRRVVIVSRQVAAAFWPGRSAVGNSLVNDGETFEVIGVVADIRHASLDRDSDGEIYSPNAMQARPELLNLLVRFDDDAVDPLPRVVNTLAIRFPNVKIVRAEMLADALGSSVQLRRFQAWLFGVFGGAALLVVGVGMLGTIAMSVARRTREVGVRMALGATSSGVAALILREQLPPVVSGIAAGALLSGWLVGFLKEYLYKMTAHDWMAWTSAIAVLVLVTMTAALVPALRASRVDPIKALRVD